MTPFSQWLVSTRGLVLVLIVMGAGWGLCMPLTKVAVSGPVPVLSVIVWQSAIGAVLLTGFQLLRGKPMPFRARNLKYYAGMAMVGTVMPDAASYSAATVLPAGIVSILLSTIPMIAFPVALAFGLERFEIRRMIGLGFGLVGVLLITLPDASLPERAMLLFVPLALIAPILYGFEGNLVAKYGTGGVDPITFTAGMAALAFCMTLPVAIGAGVPLLPRIAVEEGAMALVALLHAFIYASYFWMVGRAGAVFAAQVSYLVTGFGVLWSMVLLGERFAPTVWAAMFMMFLGLALVQPRPALGKIIAKAQK